MTSTAASLLQKRFGLSDAELLRVLDEDPLSVIAGDLEHKPELPLLLALTDGIDEAVLRRWLRTGPVELLLAREFPAFEDAVEDLRARGLVLRARREPGS